MVITGDESRLDLEQAMTNLAHRAGRVTIADKAHAEIHREINALLDALDNADA